MIDKATKILGDNKIIWYQQLLIFFGVISVLIFSIATITTRNVNYLFLTIILIIFFLLLLVLYSKLYNIDYDKDRFCLRNLFNKDEQRSSEFIEIKSSLIIPFIYAIHFRDKKYYFMKSSKEYYKNLFKSNYQYVKELNEKIKNEINSENKRV